MICILFFLLCVFLFQVKKSKVVSLFKKHNIKPCSVRLLIDPEIDGMANGLRRSNRIRSNAPVALAKPVPAKIERRRKTLAVQPNASQPPKPIIKNPARRSRSKSVTFDLPPIASSPQQQPVATTSSQSAHGIIGTPHQQPPAQPTAQLANGTIDIQQHQSQPSSPIGQNSVSSADIRSYEHRIAGLIASNQAKIARIQLLQGEVNSLRSDLKTAHEFNAKLAQTVDLYRQNDENTPPGQLDEEVRKEMDRLKLENNTMKNRVALLNQALYGERAKHEALKEAVASYSVNILQEHNYNINV